MTTDDNEGSKEIINIFKRPWEIKNISQIIKVSDGNFNGITSESFVVFNSEARMGLDWNLIETDQCLLKAAVYLRVNFPINVMLRVKIKCSRFAYELQDPRPWTIVPEKVNVWESQCKLGLNEFLIDDSITLILEMVHLKCADEIKREKKIKKEVDHEAMITSMEKKYLKMFREKERTDFTIVVENKEIHCHKCVLQTTSSIFEVRDENLTSSKLILFAHEYQCIYEFVLFLYTNDESDLSLNKYAKHFLMLGDRYKVKFLKAAAESFLISELCKDNARALAWFAHQHNAPRLRRKAEDLVQ